MPDFYIHFFSELETYSATSLVKFLNKLLSVNQKHIQPSTKQHSLTIMLDIMDIMLIIIIILELKYFP